MALEALRTRCRAWQHRHLLGTRDLSADDILLVLSVAEELAALREEATPLRGRRLFTFFVEPSTRTKTSFVLAARRLGAEVVDFSPSSSSLAKGESLKDTARTIESMGVHFTVIRHGASGAPQFLSRLVRSSVINAGDGAHEHPTQALLDLLTIRQRLGRHRIGRGGSCARHRAGRARDAHHADWPDAFRHRGGGLSCLAPLGRDRAEAGRRVAGGQGRGAGFFQARPLALRRHHRQRHRRTP
ncbi:MAG: aspartate carbamoyltransferase [Planctomycetota bacterium]